MFRAVLGILFAYIFVFFSVAPTAHALLPEPERVKDGIGLFFQETDDYRLGDEWGKKVVKSEQIGSAAPAFRRASMATARVGGATGFYIGKFQGQYVMATNHHVYPSPRSCQGATIRFPLMNIAVSCDHFLGTWPEIDLALFTVRLTNPADAAKLESVGANFQFREDVFPGQNLLTVGFGVAGNPMRQLVANQDSDCYVFSPKGEYRLMADPDRYNPGSYRTWSFALGCDVSHGDSGSAIVERETGRVVGIIWTGRIPKADSVRSSPFLKQVFDSQGQEIWEELSYAVPAKKIGEVLQEKLSGSLPEKTRSLLTEILK